MSEKYINPDSDGRFYELEEMARVNCQDCKGCSACCEHMGRSILLDPYDVVKLAKATGKDFAQMHSEGLIELTIEQGLIIPCIKMQKATDACPFLVNQRCSIHSDRPGYCRLFPLGRDFQNGEFRYILLNKLCPANKSKIKVSDWIGISQSRQYHEYIENWHSFKKYISQKLEGEEEAVQKDFGMYLLNMFYIKADFTIDEFFAQIEVKISKIKNVVENM